MSYQVRAWDPVILGASFSPPRYTCHGCIRLLGWGSYCISISLQYMVFVIKRNGIMCSPNLIVIDTFNNWQAKQWSRMCITKQCRYNRGWLISQTLQLCVTVSGFILYNWHIAFVGLRMYAKFQHQPGHKKIRRELRLSPSNDEGKLKIVGWFDYSLCLESSCSQTGCVLLID